MILIIGLALIGASQIASIFLVSRLTIAYFERKQAQIVQSVNSELVRLVKGEPCQSASLILAIGQQIGHAAGISAKTAVMADISNVAQARQKAGQEQQLALITEANPQIGAVLGGMGKRGGKMLANPLVQLAINALIGGHGNGGGQSAGSAYSGRKHRE